MQLGTAAVAQEQADPCLAKDACRYVDSVTVPWEGKMETLHVGHQMPWVVQNNLVLFPGDTAVISLPLGQEGQLPVTLVTTGDAAKARSLQSGELRFSFALGSADGMMLQAESAHNRQLGYMAVMTLPNGTGAKTSVCPIMAGKQSFEMWPHGIVQLALTNFTPEPANGQIVCR